jgi:hypothetical protein
MLIGGTVPIDDNNFAALRQSGPHAPQESVRLVDFMIHVHHENAVEAVFGQARIVHRSFFDRHIVELFAGYTFAKPVERAAVDILRQHPALWSDPLAKANGVIASPAPMSATVVPGTIPAQSITNLASPASSRAASVEYCVSPTSDTGR